MPKLARKIKHDGKRYAAGVEITDEKILKAISHKKNIFVEEDKAKKKK